MKATPRLWLKTFLKWRDSQPGREDEQEEATYSLNQGGMW